jgi:hypothetical protein
MKGSYDVLDIARNKFQTLNSDKGTLKIVNYFLEFLDNHYLNMHPLLIGKILFLHFKNNPRV